MPTLKLKHLVAVRWFHWINFPLLFLMIWSGFLIYWAYSIYSIGPLHFFPKWLYTILSGEWRYLVPRSSSTLRDSWQVMLYDLGLAKVLPPQEKYNAAQQVSYSAIILMGALSLVSGLAIYKPAQLWWLTALFGGYEGARLVHFVLTIGYLLFFVLHVAQVVRAGWNNFRGMVIGYELAGDK